MLETETFFWLEGKIHLKGKRNYSDLCKNREMINICHVPSYTWEYSLLVFNLRFIRGSLYYADAKDVDLLSWELVWWEVCSI